jgi:hypothetical protein
MSVDACFLYHLKNPLDRDAVAAALLDTAPGRLGNAVWQTDGTSFSVFAGFAFSMFEEAPHLTQVRLCLDAIPAGIFDRLEPLAHAYPDTSFADIGRLSSAEILASAVLPIAFGDLYPGHTALEEDFDAGMEKTMASFNAMMAIDSYADGHPAFAAGLEQLDQPADAAQMEALVRSIPELQAVADTLAQDDYFARRIAGTLFGPAPVRFD